MDHFEHFQGFAPEGTYETFYREDPVFTARRILKEYKGKDIFVIYDPITEQGIVEKEENFKVPNDDSSIDNLFQGVNTNYIWIRFPNDDMDSYLVQRIVIGEQQISQVERLW